MGRAGVGRLASFEVPPEDWGKKPSPRGTLSGRKSGRPQGKVIVECYCYYINIIVEPPDLHTSPRRAFSPHKITISDPFMTKMLLTLQRNDGPANRVFCCCGFLRTLSLFFLTS